MFNRIKSITYCTVAILFLISINASAQNDTALLNKIQNIEVSLSSVDDTVEDLYMMTVSFQSFYDELSPDGEWIEITKDEIRDDLKDGEGQGYSSIIQDGEEMVFIWKPALNDGTWSPYTNGKWEYTASGWMWVSNYSWGWAVYHYGRWWNSPTYGWVWLPGYVWAPAWVRWRVSEGYIGWCPFSPFAEWKIAEGINVNNYHYNNRDADWVFVDRANFVSEINRTNIVPPAGYKYLIANSQSIINVRSENSRIMNYGADVKDIQVITSKTITQKNIKVTNEKIKTLVTDNDITLYKPNLQKLSYDPATGKVKSVPHPKKFRKSPMVRKILNRRHQHQMHIRRH
jgi:hypothetical protein